MMDKVENAIKRITEMEAITIIGIPFGKQLFKIARVALLPFGAKVVRVHY